MRPVLDRAIVRMMRASAIVVAAGGGLRLGAAEPKAFVRLGHSTLLGATLRTIGNVPSILPQGTEMPGTPASEPVTV